MLSLSEEEGRFHAGSRDVFASCSVFTQLPMVTGRSCVVGRAFVTHVDETGRDFVMQTHRVVNSHGASVPAGSIMLCMHFTLYIQFLTLCKWVT